MDNVASMAMEAKVTYKQRVAERQTRNDDESKARQVWYKLVRPKVKLVLVDTVNRLKKMNMSKIKEVVPDFAINTNIGEMLEYAYDGQYSRVEIVSSGYEGIDDNQWDTVSDALEKELDTVENWLKSAVIPKLNKIIPGWSTEQEMIDDTAAVYILPPSDLTAKLVAQFTSFDSFLVELQGWDEIATEGSNDYASAAKGAARGIMLVAAGAGAIFSKTHPALGFLAAIGGVVALKFAVDDFKLARYKTKSKKNPTPAEQASLDVFNQKYAAIIQQEGEKLSQIIQSGTSEFEAIGLKVCPGKKQPQGRSPYDRMGYNAAILQPIEKGSKRMYSLPAGNLADKLNAYSEEIKEKYDGKLIMTQAGSADAMCLSIEFNWLDSDGIILPNLR